MKVLVTGGAGFIGSHIVDALVARGEAVVVLDNLARGRRDHVAADARLLEMDIRDSSLPAFMAAERFDVVIHQAAQVDVTTSLNDPMLDADVNIRGSLILLEACRRSGAKKIIYASSSAGFGDPKYLPIDEEHPCVPLSPYGVTKHTFEHFLYLYGHNYGVNWTALRYGNVYGPRQDPLGEGGVVAIFSRKMLDGVAPTIFGDGEQTRDFVYVGDVVDANLRAINGGDRCVYNIGSGVETSVNQIFRALKAVTEFPGEPMYAAPRAGEIRRMCMSIGKAMAELGWKPSVSLSEGLRRTVEFFRGKGVSPAEGHVGD